MNDDLTFPKNFLWGTATAAHQIEGNNTNNQWWEFEQQPNNIKNGETSTPACDHWNRFQEDFDLIKDLNNNAYRMSIEWSKIVPSPHTTDKTAIEHYHRMFDALLERNITPFVTLVHFTLPTWWWKDKHLLNQKDSHLNHFREFTDVVIREYGEKIQFWNTINEPNIVALAGYLIGEFPPAQHSVRKAIRAADTFLKMHAIAYRTIKSHQPDAQVGLVKNMAVFKPYRPHSRLDRLYAKFGDYIYNGATLRGLKTGKLFWSLFRKYKGLKQSYDFIGLNFYNFCLISRTLNNLVQVHTDHVDPSLLCQDLDWEPYPEGLYINLKRLDKEFNVPIYITEHGIGTNNDTWRQKVLIDHLKMIHKAITEGVDVKGYFHWSLIDNFEWASGYDPRFGLVHVDFNTQERTIKESGYVYGEIAKNNALPASILQKFPSEIYKPKLP